MRHAIPIWLLLAATSFGQATVTRIEPDTRKLIPSGKEVDAIDGDLVLQNKQLTAVIAHAKPTRNANMTVRNVSGALIDLTVNSFQSDQLSAFYPGRRAFKWAAETMGTLVEDDREWRTVGFTNSDSSVSVQYALADDAAGIRVTTTFRNVTDKQKTFKLEDDIRADGGKEYMGKNRSGDVGFAWIEDRFWGQAYGVFSEHGKIRTNTNARESVLKYLVDGESTKTLQPGEKFDLVRWIVPGKNLLDVRAAIAMHNGQEVRNTKLIVKDGLGRPVPDAQVEVRRDGGSLGFMRTDQQGVAVTKLPGGTLQARIKRDGVSLGAEQEFQNIMAIAFVDGEERGWPILKFPDYKPGAIAASITAEDGSPIPCKVELQPQKGTPKPDFGPETAEFGVKNVIYTPNGKFERAVPSGKYDVIISRGPEYDAIFTELEVGEGKTAKLTGKLVRSVKTPGWVSCDYHSHSSPSGDNTGSQLGRVLNLAAENVEFAPCTEHNRVSTYDGHIESQKLQKFLATVTGMELTGSPLPLNHQNVFPMVYRPYQQDGGGPVTDVSPEKQIERLAAWDGKSRKLIQQNHPDLGWLFYDKNGDGKPDGGYQRSFQHMDVVEIHPVYSILDLKPFDERNGKPFRNNCVFRWLQLLNQGYRVYGIVNTDAHYNYHGSGWLRNWIRSSTDDPANIDNEEMLANSEAGRLIMSNGPYLEAYLTPLGGSNVQTVSGDSVTVANGKLNAHVRVQCANWFDIDRVFILVNGRPSDELTWTREKNPDMFKDGVVKFDQNIKIELDDDAHIIVCTGHKTQRLGPVMGPSAGNHRPAAFTNPMFVNVKGEDFVPNKDTLGHPLPVKK